MDSVYFKDEIKQYIDETYEKFLEYQNIAREILIEFDRVCSLNHLNYFLAYGSLIGAARDQSLIPWDYDIDTLVRIDDREKLLEVLRHDLGDGFFYDYSDKNRTYPTSCLRIGKKGYSMMALHVDVFFLIGTPENEYQRSVFLRRVIKVMKLRKSKYLSRYLKKDVGLLGRIRSVLNSLIPGKYITFKENRLFNKYPLSKSNFWYSTQTVYKKFYPKEIFEGVAKVPVDGALFSAPIGYEQFLSLIYGDWKSYFPIKHRFEEFYKMKNLVDKRIEAFRPDN